MKRYRIIAFDFDSRARTLTDPIRDAWEEKVKEQHRQNQAQVEAELIANYGISASDLKKQNFIALDTKPFSVLAFHNRFFEQIRVAFIMGAYYPALTGTCALGERILNHLILTLRDDYRHTSEYKKVYRKESFDDWNLPISVLKSWGVLLPEVVKQFQQLRDMRSKVIHFRPETDRNDRELALEAIHCMREIIGNQFSSFGPRPWFISNIPGEIYIKKDWELHPFVRKIYLPNCALVGPKHRIESVLPRIVVNDNFEYEDNEISDKEFRELRLKYKSGG